MIRSFLRHFTKSILITTLIGVVFLGILLIMFLNIGKSLYKEENIQPADCIIVLGGGGKERISHAIDIFQENTASRIIFSGGARDNTISNAESMKKEAKKSGIQEEAIITEKFSRNTYENALFTKDIVQETCEKIILVTSDYHQKRAHIIFEKIYETSEIYDAPGKSTFWNHKKWWNNQASFHLTISEYLKIILGKLTGVWG